MLEVSAGSVKSCLSRIENKEQSSNKSPLEGERVEELSETPLHHDQENLPAFNN